MKSTLNYPAIAVAALCNLIIGFVWFTIIFRVPYTEDISRTQEQLDLGPTLPAALVIQYLGNLVLAFVLAWLISKLGFRSLKESISLSFWIWLGFVLAVIGPMYAFQAFPVRLLLISTIAVLIYLIVTALIITRRR